MKRRAATVVCLCALAALGLFFPSMRVPSIGSGILLLLMLARFTLHLLMRWSMRPAIDELAKVFRDGLVIWQSPCIESCSELPAEMKDGYMSAGDFLVAAGYQSCGLWRVTHSVDLARPTTYYFQIFRNDEASSLGVIVRNTPVAEPEKGKPEVSFASRASTGMFVITVSATTDSPLPAPPIFDRLHISASIGLAPIERIHRARGRRRFKQLEPLSAWFGGGEATIRDLLSAERQLLLSKGWIEHSEADGKMRLTSMGAREMASKYSISALPPVKKQFEAKAARYQRQFDAASKLSATPA